MEFSSIGELEWVAFPFSRGSSKPRDGTQVSCIAGGLFTSWATREALSMVKWKSLSPIRLFATRGLSHCRQILYQLSHKGSPSMVNGNILNKIKESIQNEGDIGSIPGLGISPGKGKAIPSSILAWRIPWTVLSMGSQSWTRLSDFHFHFGRQSVSEKKKKSQKPTLYIGITLIITFLELKTVPTLLYLSGAGGRRLKNNH